MARLGLLARLLWYLWIDLSLPSLTSEERQRWGGLAGGAPGGGPLDDAYITMLETAPVIAQGSRISARFLRLTGEIEEALAGLETAGERTGLGLLDGMLLLRMGLSGLTERVGARVRHLLAGGPQPLRERLLQAPIFPDLCRQLGLTPEKGPQVRRLREHLEHKVLAQIAQVPHREEDLAMARRLLAHALTPPRGDEPGPVPLTTARPPAKKKGGRGQK
jgi:hypothetical protein